MDRTISIVDFPEVMLFTEQDHFETTLNLVSSQVGVHTYQLSLTSKEGTHSPEAITLRWRLPSFNMKGVWKCGVQHDKRQQYDWELDHLQSRISVDAPLVSVFGHDDKNAITFACSDAINLVEMNALLREEDNHLYCHVSFFQERHPEISNYEAQIRIDTRDIPYYTAIKDSADWWTTFPSMRPASVPDLARQPLYSTWYQFHQDLDENILLEECEIAVKMGYKLIILDDGWQTLDNNRGYDYTGDWQPDRFKDMVGFVAKIQALGMKFGLWFSVPFCGKHSKAYQRFKGKFLTENHRWAPVFDPRYPEVRAYLIDIYANALKNWNLDAFKLDFIDDFKVYPETVLTKEDGRDYANVNAAVDRLLTDVMKALKAIKPDIAIEFRQKYIGPAMRKFGNMFRAFDCPNDAVSNRIRITDVKLMCGNSAVHSDPQTWHKEEKVELAALQVLNGFFGVPQMSIHLRNAPVAHLNMIRFYNTYWNNNLELLLDGEFSAPNPLGNYPVLHIHKDGHGLCTVYEDTVVDLGTHEMADFLNAKISASIVIRNTGKASDYQLKTWDCEGVLERDERVHLPLGIHEIDVKPAGMLRLIRS